MEYLLSPIEYRKNRMIICKGLNDLMKKFVHKHLIENFYLINFKELDKRIKMLANYIAKYDVLLINRNKKFFDLIERFCQYTNKKAILGRFLPGTFTNPSSSNFLEPDAILIFNVNIDKQALKEALKVNIPIFALCSLNDNPTYVDFIIPINNKSKKSIATFLWLLAREIDKIQGKIKSYKEFLSLQDFYAKKEQILK